MEGGRERGIDRMGEEREQERRRRRRVGVEVEDWWGWQYLMGEREEGNK